MESERGEEGGRGRERERARGFISPTLSPPRPSTRTLLPLAAARGRGEGVRVGAGGLALMRPLPSRRDALDPPEGYLLSAPRPLGSMCSTRLGAPAGVVCVCGGGGGGLVPGGPPRLGPEGRRETRKNPVAATLAGLARAVGLGCATLGRPGNSRDQPDSESASGLSRVTSRARPRPGGGTADGQGPGELDDLRRPAMTH